MLLQYYFSSILCCTLYSTGCLCLEPSVSNLHLFVVVFKDKLAAYFLSKMDSTDRKTQEV